MSCPNIYPLGDSPNTQLSVLRKQQTNVPMQNPKRINTTTNIALIQKSIAAVAPCIPSELCSKDGRSHNPITTMEIPQKHRTSKQPVGIK